MEVQKQTEVVLAWELYEQGLNKSAIARRLGRDRETVRLWLRGVEQHGLKGFVDKSRNACKVPRPARQVDALVKLWVWQIREREEQCCGQKIAYFLERELEREHGVRLSVPKIYEVLAEKYVPKSMYCGGVSVVTRRVARCLKLRPHVKWCRWIRCISGRSLLLPLWTSSRVKRTCSCAPA